MRKKMSSVQYIVVRKDIVEQMGVGKTAAQVAHASLGVVVEKVLVENIYRMIDEEMTQIIDNDDVKSWFRGPFAKLVVYVKTKQKLLNLAERLDNDGIKVKLIYDSCLTALEPEEKNGTTLTCMGVVPMNRDNVPKCLKKLRLLD
jgi:peptidyl-tRNA hydrolase